jgi:hypothetical protein
LNRWETYALGLLYGNSPGPDIRKRSLGQSIVESLGLLNSKVQWFRDIRELAVDFAQFKLFALSLIWRAGLDRASWGKQVDLGPYQEEIRICLLNENPGPENYVPFLLVDLQHEAIQFEKLMLAVELLTKKPCHLYRMNLVGYLWMFWVGKNLPSEVRDLCLTSGGKLGILVGDATPIIEQIKTLFHTLPPKKRLNGQ